jgi:hypothetical protein
VEGWEERDEVARDSGLGGWYGESDQLFAEPSASSVFPFAALTCIPGTRHGAKNTFGDSTFLACMTCLS